MGFLRKLINRMFGINVFRGLKILAYISKSLKGSNKLFSFKLFNLIMKTIKIEDDYHRKSKKKIIDKYNSLYKFEYEDWFSRNIPIWDYIFDSFNLKDKEINYLEIGSYEGRSSLFVLELLKKTNCEFVDPYIDYTATPTLSPKQMDGIYNNFRKKIEKFSDRTKVYKTSSIEFFANNKKRFDLIYIDGSHYGPDVEKDLISSYKILNKDGIIILDDLLWNHYKKIDQNPVGGIIPFIKENFKKLKVITVGDQLILQKKSAIFI